MQKSRSKSPTTTTPKSSHHSQHFSHRTNKSRQMTTLHQRNHKSKSIAAHNRAKHIANQIAPMSTSSMTSKIEALRVYTKDQPILDNYDYVIVGAGSGGISSARRAASYGAKVAVISAGLVGGVCPSLGCVPKKITWSAATVGEEMALGESFGFDQLDKDPTTRQFNWASFKGKRDAYIRRLHGIYYRNLLRDGVTLIRGKAAFDLDANGQPDLTTLTVSPVNRNDFDCSEHYIDDFKVEEFKGREVFVEEGYPIKIKVNQQFPAPASYVGSKVEPAANTTPLTAITNFVNVAPGGYPAPSHCPGAEFISTSDDFFAWTKQPRRICTTGAGYIGVELSQVLAALGSEVSYVIRGQTVLRHFDHTLSEALMPQIEKHCTVFKGSVIGRVVKLSGEEVANKALAGERPMDEGELKALFTPKHSVVDTDPHPENVYAVWTQPAQDQDGPLTFIGYYDRVLSAVGRLPGSHIMNVPKSSTDATGHIQVDTMGAINDPRAKNLFSVGDVLGKADLTPVAISFGRRLSDWLFGGKPQNPLVWHDKTTDQGLAIPTVVFSHPPIGTCGLTTAEAEQVYGKDKIRVWNAKFTPMYCALMKAEDKFQAVTKMITVREFSKYTQQEEDVVVGIHLLFPGADEAMQGFAMAVANRLPKSFVDNTIAIHPSASEELVLFR